MRAAEGVEGEHLGAVRALAELVERCRRLARARAPQRNRTPPARRRLHRGVRLKPGPGSCRAGQGPRPCRARPPEPRRGRDRALARALRAPGRSVRVPERSSNWSKQSRSSATSSVAKRYASASVTTSSRARSPSVERWRRSTETNVCSEPAAFCGGCLPRRARQGGRSARDGRALRAGSRALASVVTRRDRVGRGCAHPPRSREVRRAVSPAALPAPARRSAD